MNQRLIVEYELCYTGTVGRDMRQLTTVQINYTLVTGPGVHQTGCTQDVTIMYVCIRNECMVMDP